MKSFAVKIKSIQHITPDVLEIVSEKPQHYNFIPGQATEVSINKDGWKDQKRPFTFTSLPNDDFLQFTIKTYPSRKGVTNELLQLKNDDELILHEVFGTISYKCEYLQNTKRFSCICSLLSQLTTSSMWTYSQMLQMRNLFTPASF